MLWPSTAACASQELTLRCLLSPWRSTQVPRRRGRHRRRVGSGCCLVSPWRSTQTPGFHWCEPFCRAAIRIGIELALGRSPVRRSRASTSRPPTRTSHTKPPSLPPLASRRGFAPSWRHGTASLGVAWPLRGERLHRRVVLIISRDLPLLRRLPDAVRVRRLLRDARPHRRLAPPRQRPGRLGPKQRWYCSRCFARVVNGCLPLCTPGLVEAV